LDSHLLLLLVVGSISPDLILKHRRLQNYRIEDFRLLREMLSDTSKLLVTPNTLTETSNLAGYIGEPARSRIYRGLALLVDATETEEQYVPSRRVVAAREFMRVGLTDAVLLDIATEQHTLLTADLDLYLAATNRGLKAENFNHRRGL
jgi:hypothetical protein